MSIIEKKAAAESGQAGGLQIKNHGRLLFQSLS
jgi:hypothetical protein